MIDRTPTPSLSDTDIAWLAGLFEGEGCFMARRKKYICKDGRQTASMDVKVELQMTDRDIVERVQALFPSPGGIYIHPPRGKDAKPHWKTVYSWRISRRALVGEFIRLVLPYLGERRTTAAQEVLEWADRPKRKPDHLPTSRWVGPPRTHCSKGHPYDEANTYIRPNGDRLCRACQRGYYKAYRARKAAAANGGATT